MATLNEPPLVPTPVDEVLQIKSVKELPQVQQVPKMYIREFTRRNLTDAHLVVRAIRTDLSTLYPLINEDLLESSNDNRQAIQSIIDQLVVIETKLTDFETRISTLEGFHP